MKESSPVSAAPSAPMIGQGLALFIIGTAGVVIALPLSLDPDAGVSVFVTLVAAVAGTVGIVQLAIGAARLAGKADDIHRLYVLDRADNATDPQIVAATNGSNEPSRRALPSLPPRKVAHDSDWDGSGPVPKR